MMFILKGHFICSMKINQEASEAIVILQPREEGESRRKRSILHLGELITVKLLTVSITGKHLEILFILLILYQYF